MKYEMRTRLGEFHVWGPWNPVQRYTESFEMVINGESVKSLTLTMKDGSQFEYRVVPEVDEDDIALCAHCGKTILRLSDDEPTFPHAWQHASGLFGCRDENGLAKPFLAEPKR